MNYDDFLQSKCTRFRGNGREIDPASINQFLFPFQRDLTRWAIRKGRCAIFADTGLGKTYMALEWARLISRRCIVIAPLSVARQTIALAKNIDCDVNLLHGGGDKSVDGINITNYEMIKHLDPGEYDGVVLDECFVADTAIDTLGGTKHIQDIRKGDYIYNAAGVSKVKAKRKRKKKSLVLTSIQGRDIFSSINHPYFTTRGWVKAKDLQEGDYVIYTKDAMRMVQEAINGKTAKVKESLLQSLLLGEMENETTGDSCAGSHEGSSCTDRKEKECMVQVGQSNSIEGNRKNAPAMPDITAGSSRKNITNTQSNGTQAEGARGQWTKDARTPKNVIRCSRKGMAGRICADTRKKTAGISNTLQDRYSKQKINDSHRSRWLQPCSVNTESAGQEKGKQTTGARVDRVKVYKSTDPGLDRYRDKSGKFVLYDIEVEGHPSYSVNGLLVHNSSLLKGLTGKIRQRLTEMFSATPYRLCCTATPAPNDIAEIANHSEFLGIMSRSDMLASFFVHDDNGWRLKGHALKPFYRWLASWGMSVKKPSNLGYSDEGFNLPELTIKPMFVESATRPEGTLFFMGLKGIGDRARVRKATMKERVAACVEMVMDSNEQWLIWCGLNDEGRMIAKALDDAVLVEGQQTIERKLDAIHGFQDGKYRVMVTKAKIAGHGLNLQNCHNMAFVGLSDSWEAYYQCVRRCWRYGQKHPVNAFIVLSEMEKEVYENVMRKEEQAEVMSNELIENVQEYERMEVQGNEQHAVYETDEIKTEYYRLLLGDAVERIKDINDNTVDLSVFSPPFISLYTYSPTERDIGNSRTRDEFFKHFGYIIDNLLRVTKEGRNCAVHVSQVPAMLVRDNYIGLKDFRGDTISAFEQRGWIYHGEVCIDKDPQAQAIRTHSKALLFAQLKKDASWLRPALADYILIFRKPGDNAVAVKPDISNNEWIEWARPIWYGIRESDTLQYTTARECDDERHICPLQLGTIERVIRLWSNEGETVLSPFAGIGSEGYQALVLNRKFIGIELKRSYFDIAKVNMKAALTTKKQVDMFEETV